MEAIDLIDRRKAGRASAGEVNTFRSVLRGEDEGLQTYRQDRSRNGTLHLGARGPLPRQRAI
jgi:hypothetical protein